MPTLRQDRDFKSEIMEDAISNTILDIAIHWIRSNLNPAEVFSDDDLRTWALNNNFIEEE